MTNANCDFTDNGECAALIPAACICHTPAYQRVKQEQWRRLLESAAPPSSVTAAEKEK